MDFTPFIAGTGTIGLFGVVAALLWRLLILQNRREDATEADIRDLKIENAWCNKRVSLLIFACQRGGISIPQEVWDGPPEVVRAARRRRVGHSRGDHGRRSGGGSGDPADDLET